MLLYRVFLFSLLILVTSLSTLIAQDKPSGKVHGYVFGDYYYVVGADTAASRGSGQYSSTRKDFQAFQFRRLYLYYDHNISETFFAQFLLEGNDKVFDNRSQHSVFIKAAYLEWKNILANHNLAFGLVPTPTWSWSFAERTWNYRSIEKTITDFRGLGGAVDMGVSMRGKIDDAGTFGYVAMIGNGQGARAENNKYKKFYGQLNAKPTKELLLEGYVDYEPDPKVTPGKNIRKDKLTMKGFAAYQTKEFTVGAEVVQQTQSKAAGDTADIVPFGFSLFAWVPIPGVEGLNAFTRFDSYDPDTKVSAAGYKENFFVLGLDYMPIKDVHIMPNVWVNTYSNKKSGGTKRDADVVGRITFFVVYK